MKKILTYEGSCHCLDGDVIDIFEIVEFEGANWGDNIHTFSD